jgi:transcriptional regulator with XRE-family HTH domain
LELKSTQLPVTVKKYSKYVVMELDTRIRQLQHKRELTLRALAEAAGVYPTYPPKTENNKPGFEPGAEAIRALALAREKDPLEFLILAGKVPPQLEHIVASPSGRRCYSRSRTITTPEDWDVLSDLLESNLGELRTQREQRTGKCLVRKQRVTTPITEKPRCGSRTVPI